MNPIQLFSLAGIPISFSPWFLLLVYFAFQITSTTQAAVILILAATLSILVHELGHAFMARRYGLRPQVVIHGLGGFCAYERAQRDRDDAWIVASGPLAGFALGGVAFALGWVIPTGDTYSPLMLLRDHVVFMCMVWNTFNLIPAWPLDGGQLLRLGLLKAFETRNALRATHVVGIVLFVTLAILALRFTAMLVLPAIAAYMAYMNFAVLKGQQSAGPIRSQHRFAKGLLKDAFAARAAEDWQETARLGHQIRAEPNLPPPVLNEVWVLLGVATARLGKHREAIAYLKRARPTPEVVDAWLYCLRELREHAELQTLLASPTFEALNKNVQGELRARYTGDA